MPDRRRAHSSGAAGSRRRRRVATAVGLAVLAALSALSACEGSPRDGTPHEPRRDEQGIAAAPSPRAPVVVVGIDGLEQRLVRRMIGEGRLPHLAAMLQGGAAGSLATLEPTVSPSIWTTIATGVRPARHGILGFVKPGETAPDGGPVLYTRVDRRVKALWNVADEHGLRPCVVGWWMTWPAEDTHGLVVAQTASPPGDVASRGLKGGLQPDTADQVRPRGDEARVFELAREAGADVAARERELYGDTASWPPALRRVVAHSRWSLANDLAYRRIALDLLEARDRCDLLLVYAGLPDVLGHRFWRWTFPGDFTPPPADAEVASWGQVLPRAYDDVDAFVGRVREAAGPGANVVVVSDHGMGAWRPRAVPDLSRDDGPLLRNGGHGAARDAMIVATGPGIARRAAMEEVADSPLARVGGVEGVAALVLGLSGLGGAADLAGDEGPASMLAPGLLSAMRVRDGGMLGAPLAGAAGGPGAAAPAAPAPDPARVEQLRALGYLDDDAPE